MQTIFDIEIDFDKSSGSHIYDRKSQSQFLDLFSMYSSLTLGYNHPTFDESFYEKIRHIVNLRVSNNIFQSNEFNNFIKKFSHYFLGRRLHFNCTGALAIESSLKCAMEAKKTSNPMVLSLSNSFHGVNCWGFLTDRSGTVGKRMENFPRNNWKNVPFESLENYFNSNNLNDLVAFVLEPIQCTSGDIYIPIDQIKKIEALCKKNDICFIVDEIQTGFGVTGSKWYSDLIGIDPDIIVFGKKTQICGIAVKPRYAACIDNPYQKLDVTFDGDLLDAIRAEYIMKAYEADDLISRANSVNKIFSDELKNVVQNYRSQGLLIAFDFASRSIRDKFIKCCYEQSLLCNPTGELSVRIRPNMAISYEDIDEAIEKIKKAIRGL